MASLLFSQGNRVSFSEAFGLSQLRLNKAHFLSHNSFFPIRSTHMSLVGVKIKTLLFSSFCYAVAEPTIARGMQSSVGSGMSCFFSLF